MTFTSINQSKDGASSAPEGGLLTARTGVSATAITRAVLAPEAEFHARQEECLRGFKGSVLERGFFVTEIATSKAHFFSSLAVCSCLQALAESPGLFPPDGRQKIFFDLGCSGARPPISIARLGWKAFGIDACASVIDEAHSNVLRAVQAKFIEPESVRVAHGNFFPRDFEVARLGDGDNDRFSGYLQKLGSAAPSWEEASAKLGLSYSDVDFFYHYQVERMENILRLFSLHAKAGAVLAFTSSFLEDPPPVFPTNLAFVGECGPAKYPGKPIIILQKLS